MGIYHGCLQIPSTTSGSRKHESPSTTRKHPAGDDVGYHPSKKRKRTNHWFPPPQFWDGLPKLSLTKNALPELDRRNRSRQQGKTTGSRSATENYSPCSKHLGESASHGGPDLRGLRGFLKSRCPEHAIESTPSNIGHQKERSSSPEVTTGDMAKNTGPYDRNFQQHLIEHGVYPDGHMDGDGCAQPGPANLKSIRHALSRRRPSLSASQFSDDMFKSFQLAATHASKESNVIADVIPLIEGTVQDRHCITRNLGFTDLAPLTNSSLVVAMPDLCYGARPERLDRRVREKLSGLIVPHTQADLLVAPNYFIEVKGPDGTPVVASRQITYDMALGERGQVALLSFGESQLVYDNHAHTLGYVYQNGHVDMYATQLKPPLKNGAQPQYIMTLLGSYSLKGDSPSCRRGIAACRNARDWAMRQRDKAIMQANRRVEHTAKSRVSTTS